MTRCRATLLPFACAGLALIVGPAARRSAHGAERPAQPECDTTDLLAGLLPSAQQGLQGNASLVTDGAVAAEGASWDAPAAVKPASPAPSKTHDFGAALFS